MIVPGDAREVHRIERKAAEVDWRRFGGVKADGLDCFTREKKLEQYLHTLSRCVHTRGRSRDELERNRIGAS